MLSPLTDQEKHRVSAEVSEATQIGKKKKTSMCILSAVSHNVKGKLPNLARTRLLGSQLVMPTQRASPGAVVLPMFGSSKIPRNENSHELSSS